MERMQNRRPRHPGTSPGQARAGVTIKKTSLRADGEAIQALESRSYVE